MGSPYSLTSMRRLEVMPVRSRMAAACSGLSAVAILAAPLIADSSKASLSLASRQYGLCVPKYWYRSDLSS